MPRKMTVDSAKLLKAVESGIPSKDIMKDFGIKTSAQLKSLYLDALIEQGKAIGITGRGQRGRKAVGGDQEIRVNKRGSLVIPKGMVEEMEFDEGDIFVIRKTKSGLNLKKQ
jgi:hypothetical protein